MTIETNKLSTAGKLVEKSESLRQVILSARDAKHVARIAEIGIAMLTQNGKDHILTDTTGKLILACLLRIDVDARKSASNFEQDVTESFTQAEIATQTVQEFYKDKQVQTSLAGVTHDHVGREHNFIPEMARDESKLAQTAAAPSAVNWGRYWPVSGSRIGN